MAGTTPDLSHHFAAMASDVVLAALGSAAVEAARKSILDTIGVALAASGMEPASRTVTGMVEEDAGRADASVWGLGLRVPAASAAFANGSMAHGLDFDDQTPWGQHASSSVLPAALAVAERRGGVSGADLIAAVAAGQDIFARLRCNVDWRKDWNLSSMMGVFAGAAAASRVMSLSRTATHAALGIAGQQSAGIMQAVAGTGSDLRGVYAGFSARGAVTAALLAERGLTGVDELFEGPDGVFAAYFDGRYEREPMVEALGHDFLGAGTLYKLWPTVGTSHSHIHATISVLDEHGLELGDIQEIRVFVGDYHDLMCTPLETRRAPETLVDAKFSLPFIVAVAAVHRSVEIGHFTENGLRDEQVRSIAAKVVPVADRSLDWKLELPPGRVEVVTVDGRRFERVGADYPGSATNPTSWDALAQKFRDCAAHAAVAPTSDQVEHAIALVHDLESVADVSEITTSLRPTLK